MMIEALLVRGGTVYAPKDLGRQDVLIIGERIAAIGDHLELPPWCLGQVVSVQDALIMPGLVDQHVHIAGGGGEGGPQFRTPEIRLTQLTRAGITTVVGVLGTDGTTRSVSGLLAAARGLEAEGLTTYIYTGAYEVPTRTITDNPRNDIILIDKVLGIGEIAVSDHRGSHPSDRVLAELASEARVGGILAGKAGILHLHMGNGPRRLGPVYQVLEIADLPPDTFVPTHLNRDRELLHDAVGLGRRGGWLDITTGIGPVDDDPDAVAPSAAACYLREQGVPWDHISFSSDAEGSAPTFDARGHLVRMEMGSADTLWQAVLALVKNGVPWEEALAPATSTPAHILKLPLVGEIAPGMIANVLVIKGDMVDTVIAKGRIMVQDGKPLVYGTYENVGR